MIVGWREGEAEHVELVVFEAGIVEEVNIFDIVNEFNDVVVPAGDVVMVFAEAGFEIWRHFIEIVVAEAEADGRDFAEAGEPGREAGALFRVVSFIDAVNEIAGDCDELWLFGLGFFGEAIKLVGDGFTKMDVADGENFMFFLIRFIKAIAVVKEVFH